MPEPVTAETLAKHAVRLRDTRAALAAALAASAAVAVAQRELAAAADGDQAASS